MNALPGCQTCSLQLPDILSCCGVTVTAPELEASFSRKAPPQGCVRFSYRDLQAATGDFADNAVLGEGGFGRVYRGTLEDGTAVAVKCLDRMGLQVHLSYCLCCQP